MKKTYSDRIEYLNEKGQHHREDGPATEYIAGPFKGWTGYYINDSFHRTGGPAIITEIGSKYWYKYGRKHRLNAPAYMGSSGAKEYWEFGVQTRRRSL